MEKDIERLKEFIKNNPPLDKDGKPEWWSESDWESNLDKALPNWRKLLKDPKVWEEIKGLKPKRNYDRLLKVLLRYADDKVLVEYLKSEDKDERKSAYTIVIEDNGKRLTSNLWKLVNEETRSWIISKIMKEIREKHYPIFMEELEILLHDPEYFFERLKRGRYWVYPYIVPYTIFAAAFYEEVDILDPLWIKLKATIEQTNDLFSMKILEKYEQEFKEKTQRIIEKLKSLLQPLIHKEYPFISKNVMFDPSLLLDYEKAKKAFVFMSEHKEEFNFYISHSFYSFLREYGESNKLYRVAEFFGYEKEISPRKILNLIEEYKNYLIFFEIPKEAYKEKYFYFYDNLSKEVEDRDLFEILFEEWVFLQEFSWIVAKSKKAFEKFKEAGAVTIEFSEKAVDKLIRKTLKKKDDDFINTFDSLRALGKWIAVGGSAVTSFLNPWMATLLGFGTGIFLLLDPEEISTMEKIEDGDGV